VTRTHYQLLSVAPTASAAQIRSSYRQLAYLLHPDRQAGANDAERRLAERRMREVNVAWTTLSDPSRRAEYDLTLVGSAGAGASTRGPTGGSTSGPTAASSPGSTRKSDPAAWWDSDDPDAALERLRASKLAADESVEFDDEVDVGTFWLLRRGPVIAMVVVALVLFVLTAYAGGGATGPSATSVPPAIDPTSECVRMQTDQMAYRVKCSSNYDARVVRKEPDARACEPDGYSYAVIGNESFCVEER